MLLRWTCLAASLLFVQSLSLVAQDGDAPKNPNGRLRRSGSQSYPPENKVEKKPQSGVSVSSSASASASGFGYGNGFGQNMNGGGGFGYQPGMGFGNARAQASVTINGVEPKAEKSASPSLRKESSNNTATATSKKNKTASYSDDERSITVVESKNRIKVTITAELTGDEKTYSAKNAEELKKKFPDAYEAYQLTMKEEDAAVEAGDAQAKAKSMLEEQIDKMEKESAGNPLMKPMLEDMRRELRKQ